MNSSAPLPFSRVAILALTLLALALGGATELWQQAILVLGMGGLLLLAPPARALGPWVSLLFPALLLLALAAFLPAAWSAAPVWRQRLVSDLNLALPATRTLQPWLTAQACCFLFVGLVWAYYVLSQEWNSERRLIAARVLVSGVAILAAVAVAAFVFDFHVPNWDQEQNRGWFQNRNQTADVLAVCGLVNYALIYDAIRKRRLSGLLWLVTLAIIGAALVISYSRAGILLFFGGIVVWHLWPVQGQKKNRGWAKSMTLSMTLVFVLLTLFFLFGGNTLERFEGLESNPSRHEEFRVAIQKDALRFSLQSPWLGVGLGNFEPLFASARQASANEDRAVHPESDWLWTACEMGWFGPLLFLIGIVWWLRKCLPFQVKSGESLRRALTVAGLLFIVHGFVDVSGHRLGSLMVGLLVLSLALPDARARSPWPWGAPVFRALALPVFLVGGWWAASVRGAAVPPTSATLAQLGADLDTAITRNQFAKAEKRADAALAIAPLDWHLYFQRGYAEAFQPGQLARAGADFRAARGLESKWAQPCFDEGATWLAVDEPDLCLDAWQETLRRAPTTAQALHFFSDMVTSSTSNDQVHAGLLDMAADNLGEQLILIDHAMPDETGKLIAQLLARDADLQTLDDAQRSQLFSAWWYHGDRADFIDRLTKHPGWMSAGWFYLAQSYAAKKDFQRAWEIASRYSPRPLVPKLSSVRSLEELTEAFYERKADLATGVMLYLLQMNKGDTEGALATLHALEKLKDCPQYVFYLEAQLWAARQQWELAWDAWSQFYPG